MSWNECLYHYYKTHGGFFLGGQDNDALLLFTWKDQPLAVDLYRVSGRGSSANYVQARISVTLAKPYKLFISAAGKLSGGVNAILKAVPGLPDNSILPADFGFPEVTKKRLIRSNNHAFTKLVLGSLEFRNALLACPLEKIEVRPGPGDEGVHLITVITASAITDFSNGDWELEDTTSFSTQKEYIDEKFFPRMDRFLDLARAAYNAVTQWPM